VIDEQSDHIKQSGEPAHYENDVQCF